MVSCSWHMRMINGFLVTSYEPAGLKLSSSDYLFRETRNEAKAVMRIGRGHQEKLKLTWEQIDIELTSKRGR